MHTLQSLSLLSDSEEFSYAFRNFLDDFYGHPEAAPFVAPPDGRDATRDAYLAATCDFLCNRYRLRKPEWLVSSLDEGRYLADPPYFASDHHATRVWLLADSPQEFRQRNLFVGADALSRA